MEATYDYVLFVLAPQVGNGLSIGVAVILMALGLTIILGLLGVINLSHGEFYAMGAFIGLTLAAFGIGFWSLLVLVPLLMLPIGWVTERVLIQRVFHDRDRHILTLLVTFGLGLILEDVFRLLYGPNPHRPETPISGGGEILGIFLPHYRMFLIVVGAAIIAAVWFIVYRTSLGAMV